MECPARLLLGTVTTSSPSFRSNCMKRFLALVVIVGSSLACGQSSTPAIPSQTHPSIQPTVERLSGTVAVGGTDIKTFTVERSNGNLSLTFVEAGPPAGTLMGIGLGAPTGTTCSISSSGQVRPSVVPIFSDAVPAGTYCLAVQDVGAATGPVAYIIDVSHY
jgi:hypothetical protein